MERSFEKRGQALLPLARTREPCTDPALGDLVAIYLVEPLPEEDTAKAIAHIDACRSCQAIVIN